jgi:hypothetical protein
MKLNAYNLKQTLIVNDRVAYVSGSYTCLFTDEEVTEKKKLKEGFNFDELWDFLYASGYYCGQTLWKKTLFSRKRWISFAYISVKENSPCKWRFEIEVTPCKDFRMSDLKNLPADKVIQYCVERGATINI